MSETIISSFNVGFHPNFTEELDNGFKSAFHEDMTTLEWLPLPVSSKSFDNSQFMGSAYLDLSPGEYARFMEWDAFDDMTRPFLIIDLSHETTGSSGFPSTSITCI